MALDLPRRLLQQFFCCFRAGLAKLLCHLHAIFELLFQRSNRLRMTNLLDDLLLKQSLGHGLPPNRIRLHAATMHLLQTVRARKPRFRQSKCRFGELEGALEAFHLNWYNDSTVGAVTFSFWRCNFGHSPQCLVCTA